MTLPVALITGGARGLGRAIAVAFAKKNYAVAVHYNRSQEAAAQTKKDIEALGVPCSLFQADVADSSGIKKMFGAVSERWGRLDVLVNNAGISKDRRLEKMSDGDWTSVLDVNLTGTFYCLREAIGVMKPSKQGSIINVTSYLAKRPTKGTANYGASKAAILSLTQSAALELSTYGIRVNAVMPGFYVTDMNRDVWRRFEDQIRKQHLLSDLPSKEALGAFVATVSELKTVTGQLFPFESRLI